MIATEPPAIGCEVLRPNEIQAHHHQLNYADLQCDHYYRLEETSSESLALLTEQWHTFERV